FHTKPNANNCRNRRKRFFMAGDYYGDEGSDEAGPSEAGEGMEGGDKSMGSDTGMGETTLVPKSMFEGKELKPGDEFYFTVRAVHENEVEVEYKHDEGGEKGEGESETPEGAFDAKFSMMGGGGKGGY
ncbi:MAG TPA: hypothetical protein VFG51_00200, partial [Candidatus Saccharimonadia bacterium]|nr:hypothetical protein [Candidatus Saccharimonadia bacterium]